MINPYLPQGIQTPIMPAHSKVHLHSASSDPACQSGTCRSYCAHSSFTLTNSCVAYYSWYVGVGTVTSYHSPEPCNLRFHASKSILEHPHKKETASKSRLILKLNSSQTVSCQTFFFFCFLHKYSTGLLLRLLVPPRCPYGRASTAVLNRDRLSKRRGLGPLRRLWSWLSRASLHRATSNRSEASSSETMQN